MTSDDQAARPPTCSAEPGTTLDTGAGSRSPAPVGSRSRADAVVAVGASAGGVEALSRFVAGLPPDLPAAVLVVLHLSPTGPSLLPGILARAGPLPVAHASDGAPLHAGTILVAPPGQHLQVVDGRVSLSPVSPVSGPRPSADVLFASVARWYGRRCAGVVLSGTMHDGAAGLRAIGQGTGLTLVQDPAEAAFPGMPRAAIAEAGPVVVCRLADMPDRLTTWLAGLPPSEPPEAGTAQRSDGGHPGSAGRPPVDGAGSPEHASAPDSGEQEAARRDVLNDRVRRGPLTGDGNDGDEPTR